MIVWINGAFGAGKSTLARRLAATLPRSRTFNPELVGSVIQILRLTGPSDDYQDRRFWRYAVGKLAVLLHRGRSRTLIIPMTLVNRDYLAEIFSTIAAQNVAMLHVFLDTDAATLEERIRKQVLKRDEVRDEQVREWRLAQIGRCLQARAHMPADTVFLDSGRLRPEELAGRIVELLAEVPPTPR